MDVLHLGGCRRTVDGVASSVQALCGLGHLPLPIEYRAKQIISTTPVSPPLPNSQILRRRYQPPEAMSLVTSFLAVK